MKIDRQQILEKYYGRCAYCGVKLANTKWHVDHITPVVRDLKTGKYDKEKYDNAENLNPSCASCNRMKNSFSIEEFRTNIQNYIKSLKSYDTRYQFAIRYNLVKETNNNVEFFFEKLKGRSSRE